ncbi:MAG: glycine--tRNA ligase subunit beta, partial [Firmicutes bacterium]|nr:glycine--tRNA ligase subunit beta [Bacillota bacterium]
MAETLPFLWELGVEEMPSRYILPLITAMEELVVEELRRQRIDVLSWQTGATPRRLAIWGQASAQQAAGVEKIRGPLVSIAYKDGQPSAALEGFCRRVSISPHAVQEEGEGAKRYVVAVVNQPQDSLEHVLQHILPEVFNRLPRERAMRWNDSDDRFVRPVRWTMAAVGDHVLPVTIAGNASRMVTFGNRSDYPDAVAVPSIAHYVEQLRDNHVLLSWQERRQVIVDTGNALAKDIGGRVRWDDRLLDEVQSLVEWPVPFIGQFDPAFLQVPEPILVTSMKVHQRYFPLEDEQGGLLPMFLAVRNGQGRNLDQVRHGNEKVLTARLSDALYFYRHDQKRPLESYRANLDTMIYHAKLGTYGDKVRRMQALWDHLDAKGLTTLSSSCKKRLQRAILLAKTDLLTLVVQEFPELQGIMGGIYAREQGEEQAVGQAIAAQYRPGFYGDSIPPTAPGQWLGLLDRMDTVMNGMAQGLRPTGSEDPFGLRRDALAIGRILSEGEIFSDQAPQVLWAAAEKIWNLPSGTAQEMLQFVSARLGAYWEDRYPAMIVQAVLAANQPWATLER